MKAIEAIELNINSSKGEIMKIHELIKEACEKDKNFIKINSLGTGERLYFEYNGFEIHDGINWVEGGIFSSPKKIEYVRIEWSIEHLQKLAEERQKLKNIGLNQPKKEKSSSDCSGNFLAGVILGGILF